MFRRRSRSPHKLGIIQNPILLSFPPLAYYNSIHHPLEAEQLMVYKNLGRTGLKVSALGLGCGNFGGIGRSMALVGKGISERDACRIMDRAWEMGINFFDTADSYGGGFSEVFIGNWLRMKGSSVRDQLLLSSKVFNPMRSGPNEGGLSRIHILREIEVSLKKLGTDHLDMYLIHEPDSRTPLEETLSVLDDLIRQGKVRYIGASNMPSWLLEKALWISDRLNLRRFEWVQNSYSLLDRYDEYEMFPLCAAERLGYTPFSPIAGGFLSGKYRLNEPPPEGSRLALTPEHFQDYLNKKTFDALEELRACSAERGMDMATLALAWMTSHPFVTAPIIGPRIPEHLNSAAIALSTKMDRKEHEFIGKIFEGSLNNFYHCPFFMNL